MSTPDHYVLVTGANSGLGLGICRRLIDEFLSSTRQTGALTIIFTTRSSQKGADTLSTLEKHLARRAPPTKRRVFLRPENVELTSLRSVRALSRKLVASNIPHLNAIVLNAGIGGWSGLDWAQAVWTFLTDIRQSTTWPTYKLGLVGLVTSPQFPPGVIAGEEPVLGEVFCANTFGHYMLVHWVMPLLRASPSESPGKIIWTSSIECVEHHYNPEDHQGLKSDAAYEHTKRLTDMMALTAVDQSVTANSVKQYTTPSASMPSEQRRPQRSEPNFLLAHPGICTTTIISLFWIIHEFYRLGIYMARWCGSPWANVTSYLGAASATWLVLAPATEVQAKAVEVAGYVGGPCKWGSGCNRLGRSSIRVTDVEGWGINGTGRAFQETWWGGKLGRKTGAVDATSEDVARFLEQGGEVWKKMEDLRREWETRIEEFEAATEQKSNGHV